MRAGNGLLWIYLYFVARVSGSTVRVKKILPALQFSDIFHKRLGIF